MTKSNQPANTEVATKTKMALWKIIVLATSLTIIAALITTIIVFACVQVSLIPNKLSFASEQGVFVSYDDGEWGGLENYAKDSDKTLTIINKLSKGFSTSYLNSFTVGINSKNAYTIKYLPTSTKSYGTMRSESKYTLCFAFDSNHVLTDVNDKTFKYGPSDVVFEYNKMVVLLSDNNKGFGELEIWFFTETSDIPREAAYSSVKLTAYGDFSDVINYLDKLATEVL